MLKLRLSGTASNRIHIGSRNFFCGTCGNSYTTANGLNIHKKLYCGKEPKFSCKVCGHKFYQKVNVKSHMLALHPNIPFSMSEL
ncbi:gastrula zinc finger protein XlCGF49.1-like [Macrosteles quadrilineatus]|uniref:gastrula zinc finger protein XlCGF49.1-like n=1 Tax=Macrosteles quadrilineatus TaxID=74068 RepID=UPI0023E107D3|nr:gastrula zinc finger protein XlCGF49.1-like [Macrosteles quadrilineatus]